MLSVASIPKCNGNTYTLVDYKEMYPAEINETLTFLCLIYRFVQYLVLRGHLDQDHKVENIWTIKLDLKENIILDNDLSCLYNYICENSD